MSQSSSATTLLKAPERSLKGGLQSVLQSLDVQLEDELIRYRQQRHRQALVDKAKAEQEARLAAQQAAQKAAQQAAQQAAAQLATEQATKQAAQALTMQGAETGAAAPQSLPLAW